MKISIFLTTRYVIQYPYVEALGHPRRTPFLTGDSDRREEHLLADGGA